jgi:hypothetical protein
MVLGIEFSKEVGGLKCWSEGIGSWFGRSEGFELEKRSFWVSFFGNVVGGNFVVLFGLFSHFGI